MRIMAWADLHLFHPAVIDFCNRPFDNVAHMHEQLIKRNNYYVYDDDIVAYVGDISFGSKEDTIEILEQMNGRKILVLGNHDKWSKSFYLRHFDMVCEAFEFGEYVFTHVPLEVFHHRKINVHGHTHDLLHRDDDFNPAPANPRWLNVCVEVNDYRPVEIWKGGENNEANSNKDATVHM